VESLKEICCSSAQGSSCFLVRDLRLDVQATERRQKKEKKKELTRKKKEKIREPETTGESLF